MRCHFLEFHPACVLIEDKYSLKLQGKLYDKCDLVPVKTTYNAPGPPSGHVRSTAIYPIGGARAKLEMLEFIVHVLYCYYLVIF